MTLRRQLLLLLLLTLSCFAQDKKQETVFLSTDASTYAKRCAFDFKPKSMYGRGKEKPPTPKQELNDSMTTIWSEPAVAHYHTVCPYERAVELFGQDRVEYRDFLVCNRPEGCPVTYPKTKQILVDGEVVYEEKP